MNEDVFAGQWKQMRGELRTWWGKLTDDDITWIAGQKDKLIGLYKKDTAIPAVMPRKRLNAALKSIAQV
jgi:uncharacterized protein YjbJ (UPF0337 family)